MNGKRAAYSIERVDNNGDYCPENCRWATVAEQCRNNRRNVRLTYDGQTRVLRDWARLTGINEGTLRTRIQELGWSVEDALTKPTISPGETKSRPNE